MNVLASLIGLFGLVFVSFQFSSWVEAKMKRSVWLGLRKQIILDQPKSIFSIFTKLKVKYNDIAIFIQYALLHLIFYVLLFDKYKDIDFIFTILFGCYFFFGQINKIINKVTQSLGHAKKNYQNTFLIYICIFEFLKSNLEVNYIIYILTILLGFLFLDSGEIYKENKISEKFLIKMNESVISFFLIKHLYEIENNFIGIVINITLSGFVLGIQKLMKFRTNIYSYEFKEKFFRNYSLPILLFLFTIGVLL